MGERKENEKYRNISTKEKGKNKENTGKGSERKAAILNMMQGQTRAFLLRSVLGIFDISWVTSKSFFNRLVWFSVNYELEETQRKRPYSANILNRLK